jgi:hypothetical protein
MRLVDMHRIHPHQDNSRSCSKCGERVGIYPSGQGALKRFPTMIIICSHCAGKDSKDDPPIEAQPAGSWDAIAQEMRDSRDVSKA